MNNQIEKHVLLTRTHLRDGDRQGAEKALARTINAINDYLSTSPDDAGDAVMMAKELALDFLKADLNEKQKAAAIREAPFQLLMQGMGMPAPRPQPEKPEAQHPRGIVLVKGPDRKTNSLIVMDQDGQAIEVQVHRVYEGEQA